MSTTDYKEIGQFRRGMLIKPDVWPNGVPLTEGWEIRVDTGLFNINNGIGPASGWKLLILPLKHMNAFNYVTSRDEYCFYGDETLTTFVSARPLSSYGSGQGYQPPAQDMKYFLHSIRSGHTVSSVTPMYLPLVPVRWVPGAFYALPLKSMTEISRSTGEEYASSTTFCTSDFTYCRGAQTIRKYISTRSSLCFYDENKQFISAKAYGVEGETYEVPEGAYYFRYSGYGGASSQSSQRGWYITLE